MLVYMTEIPSHREARIKRLIYRSSYTGMKETDLLLGQFAQTHLPHLSDADIDDFEKLLEEGDPALLAWVKGDEAVPEQFDTAVFKLIKDFDFNA